MILNVLSFQQIIRLPAFNVRKIIIWMKRLENALMLKILLLNASSIIPKSNAQNVCRIIFCLMIKKIVFYKRIKSMTQIALLLIKPLILFVTFVRKVLFWTIKVTAWLVKYKIARFVILLTLRYVRFANQDT